MTSQRRLITLLDRPGFRRGLAFLATRYARRKTGLDAQVFYDEGWIRRTGKLYLAESPTFDWSAAQIQSWQQDLSDLLAIYRDWWFFQYQPELGDVVVDIGAGLGEDALLFSQAVGPQGRVISVEAHPGTFQLLQKTCRYNHLQNTICIPCALMDKAGRVNIENRPAYKANTIQPGSQAGTPVEACTLDELCAQQGIDHINFLKMNIEGAERLAIQGMTRMITHTRQLCIACHDFLARQNEIYRTKAVVMDFLQRNGFEITLRPDHPEAWARDHVYGRRRDN